MTDRSPTVTTESLDVAVLGPIVVTGAAAPFHRSAALELVVYLAFHRDGVRHAQWSLALWPDHPVSASTVHSTASDARRALGRSVEGEAHLPRGVDLRLRESVTTDVGRFSKLSVSDDPQLLLSAMRLVRGRVFAGLCRTDWAVFDGTEAEIESMVVRTALRGAQAFVQLGCVHDAEWIVRRALLISPYDERLYRALLKVTAAQGNRARLHATMAHLQTLAGEPKSPATRRAPGAPPDCLHPETRALYHELLVRPPAAGGHPARL
jgi:DNA-binding SARP family transcriptional activator